MTEPAIALTVGLLLLALLALACWPVRGLLWRSLSALRATERVQNEDALKHVHDCEYRQEPCTLNSLRGALQLGGHRAHELVQRLEQQELVTSNDGKYALTSDGRRYALRVIRTHRLWERYLADETGVAATEWHTIAEEREHRTSQEETEQLAATLGYPRFDPHGDPIPTSAGEIGPRRGVALSDLPSGHLAEVVHVEDEPAEIYAQLLAIGLHPGMRVRLLERTPQRIRFETDTDEHVLAPVIAANVTAVELPDTAADLSTQARLSSLAIGEIARVVGIADACRRAERRRLLDLGVVPGTIVTSEMSSPGGDPIAYRIRGALIALRRDQAEMIQVEGVQSEVTA